MCVCVCLYFMYRQKDSSTGLHYAFRRRIKTYVQAYLMSTNVSTISYIIYKPL